MQSEAPALKEQFGEAITAKFLRKEAGANVLLLETFDAVQKSGV